TAAGRGAAAGGMSEKAVALAEAGLKGMAGARGKLGMALVLAAGGLLAGVGVLVRPGPAAKQPAALPAAGPGGPPARAAPRARAGREGALPEGAIARLGGADSSGAVFCVAVAPDGKVMATAGADGVVRLWERATGKELRRFAGHEGWVFAVAFA